MQCSRCGSLVADTVTLCPMCGNPLGPAVDSYGTTSFAPVLPPPQPAQHLSVRNAPASDLSLASTLMASSSPVPPTMISGGPGSPPQPHYVVTPAPGSPPPMQQPAYYGAMQPSPPTQPGAGMHPLPQQSSAPMVPYGPPPGLAYPPSYPMSMPMAPVAQQGTPGLAVAALICGILGWIPFWIGFILCLLAITFGGIVLGQTKPGQQGRSLAITGLVFGLVLLLPAACGL